jgi:MSHA biogenesis protein MshM
MACADLLPGSGITRLNTRPVMPPQTDETVLNRQHAQDFFASPLMVHKLAALRELVRKSRLIVITGEHGIGKTAFIHRFMAEGTCRWRRTRIRFRSPRRSAIQQCPHLINRPVFISVPDGGPPVQPSLIIDDAHQLNPLELRTVVNGICSRKRAAKLHSIILVTEPSIREHFADMLSWIPSGATIDKMHLSPLSETQSVSYLQYRLKAAGYAPPRSLTDSQARRIYEASGGFPLLINILADRMLDEEPKSDHSFKNLLVGWWRMAAHGKTRPWDRRLQPAGG